jgi:uncharacterized membrane protein YgdD (TMEM256/DUF423 family)
VVVEARLATWQTGVEYHLFHSAGLTLVGLTLNSVTDSKLLEWSGWLMLAGTLIFSGTLYALVLLDIAWLGAITPLGGLCLISSWILYVVALARTE